MKETGVIIMDDFDKRVIIREEELDPLFSKAITLLNQALLDIEALMLLGTIKERNRDHYIDSSVKQELFEVIRKVNVERLKIKHRVDKSVDNVSFLEDHPSFILNKIFDELEKDSDE